MSQNGHNCIHYFSFVYLKLVVIRIGMNSVRQDGDDDIFTLITNCQQPSRAIMPETVCHFRSRTDRVESIRASVRICQAFDFSNELLHNCLRKYTTGHLWKLAFVQHDPHEPCQVISSCEQPRMSSHTTIFKRDSVMRVSSDDSFSIYKYNH